MLGALHDAVALELSEVRAEHLVRDAFDAALQLREALRGRREQAKDDRELPASVDDVQAASHEIGGAIRPETRGGRGYFFVRSCRARHAVIRNTP